MVYFFFVRSFTFLVWLQGALLPFYRLVACTFTYLVSYVGSFCLFLFLFVVFVVFVCLFVYMFVYVRSDCPSRVVACLRNS